uniref:Uncharacterized protein n=1 Tax=Cyanothece sp. (strain PCC 7425 / ATCC 29141) TaxID=395961 RepID=B8HS41_CYAP4
MKVLALAFAIGTVCVSLSPAEAQVVIKGTKCHPDSPQGFCCPNDGRPSGPYCPARPITTNTNTQNQ